MIRIYSPERISTFSNANQCSVDFGLLGHDPLQHLRRNSIATEVRIGNSDNKPVVYEDCLSACGMSDDVVHLPASNLATSVTAFSMASTEPGGQSRM